GSLAQVRASQARDRARTAGRNREAARPETVSPGPFARSSAASSLRSATRPSQPGSGGLYDMTLTRWPASRSDLTRDEAKVSAGAGNRVVTTTTSRGRSGRAAGAPSCGQGPATPRTSPPTRVIGGRTRPAPGAAPAGRG